MKITLDIPEYQQEKGFKFSWENNFFIESKVNNNIIEIKCNKAGLLSLAKQLITLAQDDIPNDYHIHYDDYNSLEEDSNEIIIQKI